MLEVHEIENYVRGIGTGSLRERKLLVTMVLAKLCKMFVQRYSAEAFEDLLTIIKYKMLIFSMFQTSMCSSFQRTSDVHNECTPECEQHIE